MNKFLTKLHSTPVDRRRAALMRRFKIKVRHIHASVFGRKGGVEERIKEEQKEDREAEYWSHGIENVPFEAPSDFPIQWL